MQTKAPFAALTKTFPGLKTLILNPFLTLALTLTSALAISSAGYGWGIIGHKVVGEIADRHLSPAAQKQVRAIFGKATLADMAVWADEIKSDPENWSYTYPWHWVSIDDKYSVHDYPKSAKGDVIVAMTSIRGYLENLDRLSDDERRNYLAFYVHFMGDIHQPLHVGRTLDQGGNRILTNFFSEYVNLHVIWDTTLIETKKLSYSEYADYLDRPEHRYLLRNMVKTGPLDWAAESKALRSGVYDFDVEVRQRYLNLPFLKWQYRYANLPTIEERLRIAGYRLAWELNDLFKDDSSSN